MLCPICNAEKERKDFKRLATLAQTRAWIRNPLATKRITYIGKECNDCHKQTVRKSQDLTPNELHKRLVNQGKNPLMIEVRVAQRRAKGSKKKSVVASRAMREYWKTKKSKQSNNQEGE